MICGGCIHVNWIDFIVLQIYTFRKMLDFAAESQYMIDCFPSWNTQGLKSYFAVKKF